VYWINPGFTNAFAMVPGATKAAAGARQQRILQAKKRTAAAVLFQYLS
jgi:hypothetical protein